MITEMQSGDRPVDDNETVLMPLELSAGESLGPAPANQST